MEESPVAMEKLCAVQLTSRLLQAFVMNDFRFIVQLEGFSLVPGLPQMYSSYYNAPVFEHKVLLYPNTGLVLFYLLSVPIYFALHHYIYLTAVTLINILDQSINQL